MNKFYFILLSFIVAFSAMSMAAEYTEPEYTCDKYDSGDKKGQDKAFEDFTDSYVETITLTNGDNTKEWKHNGTRVFWNVMENMTMDAQAGETISAHFVSYSLGEYDEINVKQDLRYTAVVLAIDWNADGTFEYAQKIVGNTPPTHNVGGNMDVLDFTYDIEVPSDANAGTARVRFNYTNAWFGDKTANDFINTCKEGIVYDFDINIVPKSVENFAITITPNENADIVVKNGENEVISGDPVAEGTTLTVEATPHEGYRLVSIMAGEEDITSTKSFTVKEETTITVTVEEIEYVTVSYSVTGDEESLENIELYDSENNLISNGSEIELGSQYTIIIYPKDKATKVSVTLNGDELDLVYDDELEAYSYSETADADQTFIIEVTGEGSGIENANVSGLYYNAPEQVIYANNAKVTVYDMTGRVVLVNEGNTSVSHLADGIYTAVVDGKALKFNK